MRQTVRPLRHCYCLLFIRRTARAVDDNILFVYAVDRVFLAILIFNFFFIEATYFIYTSHSTF